MVGRKGVATTLGFSTIDGLVMGTRCGDVDAGIPNYLAANVNMFCLHCTMQSFVKKKI